jgi:GINS complex subunit 1
MQQQAFYGDMALKLVKEAKRTQSMDSLPAYRSDLVRDIQIESKYLESSLAKSPTLRHISLLCMKRSKRCVLAYQRARLDLIVDKWWTEGCIH